ncbi:MAG TPA: SDR family NAD(P)-dependent oxidoreductase [Anaerolineales bacterium]|nr:SDR family NAD(P)-dependent oxidoreductase [Anaerolineales bacterium]
MTSISNKNILLTGGSRGLGPFLARALAQKGANLALVARDEQALQSVCAKLQALGVTAVAIAADLTDTSRLTEVVARARQVLGSIDILVNNAAIESEGEFELLTSTDISKTICLNLEVPMLLTNMLLPEMLARKSGHILNIGSVGGKKGAAYDALYCGTKAAISEWSIGLASEYESTGVQVSVVCPGYVENAGMFAKFGMESPALLGSTTPEKVAAAVVQAIETNQLEVIVNSIPVRPLLALNALSPAIGNWLVAKLGVKELQKRKIALGKQKNA